MDSRTGSTFPDEADKGSMMRCKKKMIRRKKKATIINRAGSNNIIPTVGPSKLPGPIVPLTYIPNPSPADDPEPEATQPATHQRARGVRSIPWKTGRRRGGKHGEGAGADEGGGVRAVAVPAEGDAGAVEGHHHQDPPQGHGELDLRHAPRHPSRRHLPVSPRAPCVLAR